MIILNHNLDKKRLDSIYKGNYYWYLKSPQFLRTFLKPIGDIVNSLELSCLDVACGEGQLRQFVKTHYTGFDGSSEAIFKARLANKTGDFVVGRLEDPPELGPHGVVVFGGVLEVLVDRRCHLDLINLYRERYECSHFIIYDLKHFDHSHIDDKYNRMSSLTASIESDLELQEVKKHRKILTYQCQ